MEKKTQQTTFSLRFTLLLLRTVYNSNISCIDMVYLRFVTDGIVDYTSTSVYLFADGKVAFNNITLSSALFYVMHSLSVNRFIHYIQMNLCFV